MKIVLMATIERSAKIVVTSAFIIARLSEATIVACGRLLGLSLAKSRGEPLARAYATPSLLGETRSRRSFLPRVAEGDAERMAYMEERR
jgi:hypothetical protein